MGLFLCLYTWVQTLGQRPSFIVFSCRVKSFNHRTNLYKIIYRYNNQMHTRIWMSPTYQQSFPTSCKCKTPIHIQAPLNNPILNPLHNPSYSPHPYEPHLPRLQPTTILLTHHMKPVYMFIDFIASYLFKISICNCI